MFSLVIIYSVLMIPALLMLITSLLVSLVENNGLF